MPVIRDPAGAALDITAALPRVTSGAGAPATAPSQVGDIYIDTTADRAYIATDTATAADWDLAPITAAQIVALFTGTPDGTKYLKDDGTLGTPAGGGSVATDAIFDAAGDLVQGTGANTAAKLPIGTAGQILKVNSGATAAEWGAIGAALGADAFKQAQATNAQTGTTYTLVAGDAGTLVTLSNAAAITLTVPQDSDATIAVGTYVDLYQLGAGQVTVAAGTGATLRVSGLTAKARAQYSRLGLQKVSANTWSLFGDLAAA